MSRRCINIYVINQVNLKESKRNDDNKPCECMGLKTDNYSPSCCRLYTVLENSLLRLQTRD